MSRLLLTPECKFVISSYRVELIKLAPSGFLYSVQLER